jgi:hypothetical protein
MTSNNSNNLEFRIIPNGDGRWYWEVLRDGRDARKANLLASNAD